MFEDAGQFTTTIGRWPMLPVGIPNLPFIKIFGSLHSGRW